MTRCELYALAVDELRSIVNKYCSEEVGEGDGRGTNRSDRDFCGGRRASTEGGGRVLEGVDELAELIYAESSRRHMVRALSLMGIGGLTSAGSRTTPLSVAAAALLLQATWMRRIARKMLSASDNFDQLLPGLYLHMEIATSRSMQRPDRTARMSKEAVTEPLGDSGQGGGCGDAPDPDEAGDRTREPARRGVPNGGGSPAEDSKPRWTRDSIRATLSPRSGSQASLSESSAAGSIDQSDSSLQGVLAPLMAPPAPVSYIQEPPAELVAILQHVLASQRDLSKRMEGMEERLNEVIGRASEEATQTLGAKVDAAAASVIRALPQP